MNEQLLKKLAEKLDLKHDGGGNDTRLFTKAQWAETLKLSKKEYEAMENRINNFGITGKGFEVYAWNDSSGYNYWTKQQKEDNYIQITANISKPEIVNALELHKAIEKAELHFEKYRDENYFDHAYREYKPSAQEIIKEKLGVK